MYKYLDLQFFSITNTNLLIAPPSLIVTDSDNFQWCS